MYSSNARQYVERTTSAPLTAKTSRRRSTLSCSRLICGAVAVRLSTPSMSRKRMGFGSDEEEAAIARDARTAERGATLMICRAEADLGDVVRRIDVATTLA